LFSSLDCGVYRQRLRNIILSVGEGFGLIANIQALRAIACLLVLCSHTVTIFNIDGTVSWMLPLGGYGVDIFFVISGFVVARVAHRSDRGGLDFALKRVIRIYPIYWVVLAASFVVINVFRLVVGKPIEFGSPVFNILLLPAENPLMPQAWSMVFEVYFYAILSFLLVIAPRRLFQAVAFWGAASVVAVAIAYAVLPPLPVKIPPFHPLVFEFLLGIAVAYVVERNVLVWPKCATAAGVLLFIAGVAVIGGMNNAPSMAHVVFIGAPAAVAVYGLIGIEIRDRIVLPAFLQHLGDASYSLYLWHVVFLLTISRAAAFVGIDTPWLAVLGAVLAIVFSLVSYRYLERPLIDKLKLISSRRRRLASVAP
jgi:peptidoglycan/LPS O-acetylase OafA/YrhL